METATQEPSKAELVHYEHEREAPPARKAFVIIQCWPQMPLVEVTVELGNFRPYVSSWQEVILLPLLIECNCIGPSNPCLAPYS